MKSSDILMKLIQTQYLLIWALVGDLHLSFRSFILLSVASQSLKTTDMIKLMTEQQQNTTNTMKYETKSSW